MPSKPLLASLLLLIAMPMFSQTAPPAAPAPASGAKKTAAAPAKSHQVSEGEQIFQANCARCHNSPEGFSPRITNTVLRHMRIRASLSKHDEDELLRFFNP
jgi:cytochrome c5